MNIAVCVFALAIGTAMLSRMKLGDAKECDRQSGGHKILGAEGVLGVAAGWVEAILLVFMVLHGPVS